MGLATILFRYTLFVVLCAPFVMTFMLGARMYEHYENILDHQIAPIIAKHTYGMPMIIFNYTEKICRAALCTAIRINSTTQCYMDYAELAALELGDPIRLGGHLLDIIDGQPICTMNSDRNRVNYDVGVVLMVFSVVIYVLLTMCLSGVIFFRSHPFRSYDYYVNRYHTELHRLII